MKMHHAIADCHTAVEITTKMHDEGLAQLRKLPATTQPHYQAPDLLSKMSRVLSNNMRHAANLVNPLLKAGPKVGLKLMGAMLKPMGALSKAPVKTRFNQPISTDRTWDCTSFALQEIKQVSQLIPGATVNDVVLTIVAGALRQYFESKGDSLEHCLRALAPINVRQEQEHHQAGNEVAMFFPDLPVNIADPVDRMFAVVQSTHNAKKIAEDLGSRDLSDFTKNIPPAYVSYLEMLSNLNSTIGNLINHVGHTVVTNVPGPTHELHFSGARLVNLTGVLLISDGMGLNHVINSYAGKLNISATSCPKLLPDIEFYMQCLQDSFAQLQLSAQQRYQQALPVEKKDAKPAAKKKPVKRAVKRVPKAAVVSSKSEPKRPPAKKAKAKESAKPKPAVAQTATSKPTMPKATDAKASTSKPANPKPVVAKTPTSKVTGTKASMSKPASPKAVAKAESELKSAM
jgi:WS/DGAT/MGAT family acyltransferase